MIQGNRLLVFKARRAQLQQRLRHLVTKSAMSYREIALRAEISATTVSRSVDTRHPHKLTPSAFEAIIVALGLRTGEFLVSRDLGKMTAEDIYSRYKEDIPRFLSETLSVRGIKSSDFAREMGVSRATLQRAKRSPPTLGVYLAAMRTLGEDPVDFLMREH